MLPVTAEASSRCFPHDVSIGGYTVPANTWIWTYILIMQRSPKVWEDPDAYLPVRHAHQLPPLTLCSSFLSSCRLPPHLHYADAAARSCLTLRLVHTMSQTNVESDRVRHFSVMSVGCCMHSNARGHSSLHCQD